MTGTDIKNNGPTVLSVQPSARGSGTFIFSSIPVDHRQHTTVSAMSDERQPSTQSQRPTAAPHSSISGHGCASAQVQVSYPKIVLYLPFFVVIAGWMCLQALAIKRTLTSDAFFDNFCQYRSSIVPDWMCSSRNEYLVQLREDYPKKSFLSPFESILHSSQRTMSYELPYHVTRYETKIRSFDAVLPTLLQSAFFLGDQQEIREKATEFIIQSDDTISSAQLFFTHIVGTINTHVSDTRILIQKLNETGVLSSQKPILDGALAKSIAWLDSYHLVFLPLGSELFYQGSMQDQQHQAVILMEDLVRSIVKRLQIDIDLILTLQGALWKLAECAEEFVTHVARYESLKRMDQFEKYGVNPYQITQRGRWLETMGPVLTDATTFIGLTAHEMTVARLAFQRLLARLSQQRQMAADGRDVTQWMRERATELIVGFNETEAPLEAFRAQQLEFDGRADQCVSPSYGASAVKLT